MRLFAQLRGSSGVNMSKRETDYYFKQACETIPKIVKECKVVTDREIKVRVEGQAFPGTPGPFPWVSGYALEELVKRKILRICGYAGRRRIRGGVTNKFYCLYETSCSEVSSIIQVKRRVSADVNSVLTGDASASYHAEDIFLEALEDRLGFVLLKRNAFEFTDMKVTGVKGKKPPDIDFVLEREGIFFGVDVKNWIRYEHETPQEIRVKLKVAAELDLVPFIIARYIDRELINHIVYGLHGLVYEYKELIIQPSLSSLAKEAKDILGYPVIAVDSLPDYMVGKIESICDLFFAGKA